MSKAVLDHSLAELHQLIVDKEVSIEELALSSLAQAQVETEHLHSFISLQEKQRLQKLTQELQSQLDGPNSLLFGIPFSMKDAYCTSDLPTTSASKVLQGFIPPFDATAYKKLKAAGAVLIGKNNQDAWGHGSSTENTDFGAAINPWDTSRVPGGSSGGPAISVATRTVAFSVGEDTGGSIRNPANMCNVTGLKVTYGRVSRYGAIAYASSLDTVGPITKSAEDAAYLLEFLAGFDPLDGTSSSRPVGSYVAGLKHSIKGLKVGIPQEFYGEGLDSEVKEKVMAVANELEKLGAEVIDVSIPAMRYGVSIYYLLACSETSSNLARYDGVRFGHERSEFTEETKRRIMLGTFALSAGYADELYLKAQKARTMLIQEYQKAFDSCDILLAPVTPTPAPKRGELSSDPIKAMLEDLYTVTINVVGVPSLALPAGFSSEGVPIGCQLIGPKFAEDLLLRVGYQYQQVTDWHTHKPPTPGGAS